MKISKSVFSRVMLVSAIAVASIAPAIAQTYNTAYGTNTLSPTAGYFGSAFGYAALESNTTGNSNTGIGAYALNHTTTGNYNTATRC